jgi:hypothetical protein
LLVFAYLFHRAIVDTGAFCVGAIDDIFSLCSVTYNHHTHSIKHINSRISVDYTFFYSHHVDITNCNNDCCDWWPGSFHHPSVYFNGDQQCDRSERDTNQCHHTHSVYKCCHNDFILCPATTASTTTAANAKAEATTSTSWESTRPVQTTSDPNTAVSQADRSGSSPLSQPSVTAGIAAGAALVSIVAVVLIVRRCRPKRAQTTRLSLLAPSSGTAPNSSQVFPNPLWLSTQLPGPTVNDINQDHSYAEADFSNHLYAPLSSVALPSTITRPLSHSVPDSGSPSAPSLHRNDYADAPQPHSVPLEPLYALVTAGSSPAPWNGEDYQVALAGASGGVSARPDVYMYVDTGELSEAKQTRKCYEQVEPVFRTHGTGPALACLAWNSEDYDIHA